MYARSLAVVALCTMFVVAFLVVLNLETSGIGNQSVTVPTTATTCSPGATSCDTIEITSATLRAFNYTSELGPGNYATLSFRLRASGGSTITSVKLFIGNTPAGSLQGPFQSGMDRVENLTLPSTVVITQGRSYVLSVEGVYGSGLAAWASTAVTAQ